MSGDFENIRDVLREFASKRDWKEFHTPKNLAMALSVEASEVLEHFQWLTGDESDGLTNEARDEVEKEIADVLIYAVQLADRLGVKLPDAVFRKIGDNAMKYPVSRDVFPDARAVE